MMEIAVQIRTPTQSRMQTHSAFLYCKEVTKLLTYQDYLDTKDKLKWLEYAILSYMQSDVYF